MKLVAVLAVLAAVLLVARADFYAYLYYEPTRKYVNIISYRAVGGFNFYLKAALDSTTTQLHFVTSGLSDGQVAIKNKNGDKYYCPDSKSNIRPVEMDNAADNCIYDYKVVFKSDSANDICSYSIALKANNGLYWTLGGFDSKFIRATSQSPDYFDVLKP